MHRGLAAPLAGGSGAAGDAARKLRPPRRQKVSHVRRCPSMGPGTQKCGRRCDEADYSHWLNKRIVTAEPHQQPPALVPSPRAHERLYVERAQNCPESAASPPGSVQRRALLWKGTDLVGLPSVFCRFLRNIQLCLKQAISLEAATLDVTAPGLPDHVICRLGRRPRGRLTQQCGWKVWRPRADA